MSVSSTDEVTRVDTLREAMIAELRELDAICTDRVADAFRAVPRHLFGPGESLENAYAANGTLVTKKDEHGIAVSTVSAPRIQAMMLEQARLEPGMRVLEIGSGGYNAALIAELVGESGQVTTVDIDPEVVDRAQRCLATAGYDKVTVVLADAEDGVRGQAPFDRVIVTVGAWDIPPAWSDQLADGGLIIVPLRMRSLTRSVVFEREGDHLVSLGYELCSFVPMRGVGECRERLVPLDGDTVGLRLDDGQQVDAELLRAALRGPRVEAWSGVTSRGNDRFDGLHLWLAMSLPMFGLLKAEREARDRGVVAHAWPLGVPTAIDGGSFAYLGLRPVTPDRDTCEFGAYGHGPDAEKLVGRVVRHIQTWDGTSLGACIEVHPAGTPNDQLPEGSLVIDKKHTRVAISWPSQHPALTEVTAGDGTPPRRNL